MGRGVRLARKQFFPDKIPEWCWGLTWLLSQSLHQTAVQMLLAAGAEWGGEIAGRGLTAFL